MIPTASQIRRQFIDFFVKKYGHREIPSASLIPENDPTVLFTTAGMHPLVPYLMGEPHPSGRRLVNAQKCIRTVDIDEVGDNSHLTFFEMLGNWSLGDYFKEEAIKMSFEFLTSSEHLNLDKRKLSVTVFGGDKRVPQVPIDDDAAKIWKSLGIAEDKIAFMPGGVYEREDNWWGPAGEIGPCGPSTEMFYWIGAVELPPLGSNQATDKNNWLEIWNDVFMQFDRKTGEKFEPLKQKNVDTGMGLERVLAMLQGKKSVYETDAFIPAIHKILSLRGLLNDGEKIPDGPDVRSIRIVADHLKAATFLLGDSNGVSPSNVDQGYIVRRLIRRAIRHFRLIGNNPIGHAPLFTHEIAKIYIQMYRDVYPELAKNQERILTELNREEERFQKTLERGLREMRRIIDLKEKKMPYDTSNPPKLESDRSLNLISGKDAFYIFETYGFPLEMIQEELAKEGMDVEVNEFKQAFDKAFKQHQDLSRAGATQKFAGGLADHSEQSKMHHTATHLVHQALRDVLGPHVFQKGSNITKERLRFDFSYSRKMTPEEINKVEEIVNAQIERDMPVHFEILDVEDAKRRGAIGLFEDKYAQLGNKVKVYFMGDYSREVCGGPHVEHTGVLKHFKILREEACSSGIRRIKAIVDGIKDVK